MAAVISQQRPSRANWEETIVPTLRKRLENESRILSNRLSSHSITFPDDHPLSNGAASTPRSQRVVPSTSSAVTPRKEKSAHRIPPSTAPIPRYTTDFVRPSAIPRPSMNREASDHRQNGNGVTSPPLTNSSTRGVPGQRTRTRSSPYAFDHDDKDFHITPPLPAGRGTPTAVGSGIPTPAQSRSNSPMVPLPPSERPSRIPTAAAKRARSNSNAASSESAARSAKRPSQPNSKPPRTAPNGTASDHGYATVDFPPSPDPSPELWLQNDQEDRDFVDENAQMAIPGYEATKIRDEAPPFNPNRASRISFEEREFEHWYRGEGRYGGGRNGGRGEIKVAKVDSATEMLEIAVGGHKLHDRYDHDGRAPRRRADSLTNRASNSLLYDDPEPDPHMDYVLDERPLTDVDTDLTDYDHGNRAFSPQSRQNDERIGRITSRGSTSVESASTNYHEVPSSSRTLPVPSSGRRPSSDRKVSTSSGKSTLKASTSTPRPSTETNRTHSRSAQIAVPSSRSAISNGSSKPTTTKPNANGPPPTRSRSQSKPKKPRTGSSSQAAKPTTPASKHTPLVDAVPWTQPDYISTTGNWDDVVLPTLAKKMGLSPAGPDDGIELNALEGGFNAKAGKRSQEQEEVYEPAPGMFGYDPSKRRVLKRGPVDDFSHDQYTVEDEYQAPPSPKSPIALQRPPSPPLPAQQIKHYEYEHPIRTNSPPPFSAYTRPAPPAPLTKPPPITTQPMAVVATPPIVHSPHQQKMPVDDDQAGCCKCVIM